MPRDARLPSPIEARLDRLRALGVLDSPRERDFDDIVAYVARLCDAPIAFISLVDTDRQWFKAAHGFDRSETPLDQTICLHALSEERFVEVSDTALDPRTRDSPLCTGPDGVRFYGGAVLRVDEVAIGSLCVLDRRPRRLDAAQRDAMILLARQVVRQLQLREALSVQERLRGEIDHRIKNSLQMVASYLRLQRRDAGEAAHEVLRQAEQQVAAIVALHAALGEAGSSGSVDLRLSLGRIAELIGRTLPANVRIATDIAPAIVDSDRAAAAGLILNEFVANSVKHAFPDDGDGRIDVRGAWQGGRYCLVLRDDGVGLGGASDGDGDGGFGMSIMRAAARQLGARMSRPETACGTAMALSFAAAPPDD